jgi:uncharacterized low-complexity protein
MQMRVSGSRLLTILAVVLAVAALAWAPRAAAQDVESVDVTMNELNASGVSGSATVAASGEETVVTLALEGATGAHPAHIHQGTCDTLNPNPEYTLTDVAADGSSETTVPVALADLLAGEFAINVHLSADEVETYVACGNIVAAEAAAPDVQATAAPTEAAGTGGTTTTAPSTGVGATADGRDGTIVLGLAALAAVLAVGGLVLRRRELRA